MSNALDDLINSGMYNSPLPPDMISKLQSMPSRAEREERQQRMIDHGDVDPDYFNR